MDYFNLNTPIKFGETEEDRERKRLEDEANFKFLMEFKNSHMDDDEDDPYVVYLADMGDAEENY